MSTVITAYKVICSQSIIKHRLQCQNAVHRCYYIVSTLTGSTMSPVTRSAGIARQTDGCTAKRKSTPIWTITLSRKAKFIKLKNGKSLLMYDRYTFSKPSELARSAGTYCWRCTGRGSSRCNMYIHVDGDLQVLRIFNEHSHLPPRYISASGGFYIRI
ncbi:unnamed protein product [Parnassius mnemosyne]|uniref:FLYWCH-type domain-containing protein n=1 Tax=Parnassius mnemosyne TaxID=213953 RepID=A0AAV1K8E7_9NEOP